MQKRYSNHNTCARNAINDYPIIMEPQLLKKLMRARITSILNDNSINYDLNEFFQAQS